MIFQINLIIFTVSLSTQKSMKCEHKTYTEIRQNNDFLLNNVCVPLMLKKKHINRGSLRSSHTRKKLQLYLHTKITGARLLTSHKHHPRGRSAEYWALKKYTGHNAYYKDDFHVRSYIFKAEKTPAHYRPWSGTVISTRLVLPLQVVIRRGFAIVISALKYSALFVEPQKEVARSLLVPNRGSALVPGGIYLCFDAFRFVGSSFSIWIVFLSVSNDW